MVDGEQQGLVARAVSFISASGVGFIWFFLLALWGGTSSYVLRLRQSAGRFSLMELIGEWAVSAFAGIIMALICYELHFSFYATAALAGISGHMGGRAIAAIERVILHWVGKYTGVDVGDKTK